MPERYKHDVILCLAGISSGPQSDSESRARHAGALWHTGLAPEVVITGAYPALLKNRPPQPYAHQMQQTLHQEGLPASAVTIEDQALTTIENILFSKRLLHSRRNIALVTSPSHADRALQTTAHILGSQHTVTAYPSLESHEPNQGLQEHVGSFITWLSFRGTEPGQDARIAANHARIFPGTGRDRVFTHLQVVANSMRALAIPH